MPVNRRRRAALRGRRIPAINVGRGRFKPGARRRRFGGRRAMVPRGVNTMANIPMFQKMRYVQRVALSPGAGTLASFSFGANALFDPPLGGGGHQPMRFDQISLFYNHYVVVGSKITVIKVGTGTTLLTPVMWGVYLDDSTTGPTEFTDLIEQGRTRFALTNQSLNQGMQRVTKFFSAKRFFNIKNPKDNVTRVGADTTANPTELAVYRIWAQALNNTSTPTPEDYYVQIDYSVVFSEPRDLAAS